MTQALEQFIFTELVLPQNISFLLNNVSTSFQDEDKDVSKKEDVYEGQSKHKTVLVILSS